MILPWIIGTVSSSTKGTSKLEMWLFMDVLFTFPEIQAQDQANNSAELLLHVGKKKYPKAISCVAFLILDSVSLEAPSIKALCEGMCISLRYIQEEQRCHFNQGEFMKLAAEP